jgi:hypothetical protein
MPDINNWPHPTKRLVAQLTKLGFEVQLQPIAKAA